jgi:hypothetical protein
MQSSFFRRVAGVLGAGLFVLSLGWYLVRLVVGVPDSAQNVGVVVRDDIVQAFVFAVATVILRLASFGKSSALRWSLQTFAWALLLWGTVAAALVYRHTR